MFDVGEVGAAVVVVVVVVLLVLAASCCVGWFVLLYEAGSILCLF